MERTETSEEENVFIKPVSCTERLSDGCSDGGSIRLRKRSKVQYHLSDENEGKETDSLINDEKAPVCSDSPAQLDLFHFIWKELTRGYSLQNDVSRYKEKRRKVYAFLRIPIELEKFLFYGFLQCVDAFFYLSTFLPIRFFLSVFGFLSGLRRWTSADTCDLLKVIIVVVASLLMQIVDTSIMYHQVRGQGIIKLYIFYNMLEVADKLFSSFGQDVLDALFWSATENESTLLRTLFHLTAAVIYAILHTILVLLQATTLNVAFNSHSQALLAIMMSNNFVELKGSVFKKFGKPNLFQMSCSDVRERFHILVLLTVVVIRNMMAVDWKFDHFNALVPDLAMVICGEFLVDWLKHAFITKFNEIPAEVYRDFTITIAFDVMRSRDENAYSDYSDQVSRRMGFIPIPLTIMLLRVLSQSFTFSSKFAIFLAVLTWILMLTIKVLNGIVLLGMACEHVNTYRDIEAQTECELYRRRLLMKKSKSVPNSPRISLIDFSDVLHQTTGTKGFTVSDLMEQWDELRRAVELSPSPELCAPRRSQSMANFSQPRRDTSLPPPSIMIPECDEREETNDILSDIAKSSTPRRRMPTECEDLTDVQAYTMLQAAEHVSGIQ